MPLSPLELKLAASITARAQALEDDLRLHVSIPTGLGHASGLAETRQRFCERLVNLGASVELVPGDPRPQWLDSSPNAAPIPPTALCKRLRNGGSAKHVLIAGHLDTVHDPFATFRSLSIAPGGKTATGPGCVDMKGGLVIALAALEALDDAGVHASWSFVMNSDEETGSFHSDSALRAAAAGHHFGLALEPAMSKGELAIRRGGSGQFVIECTGKAAHVGRDFASGISAVEALCRTVTAAHALSKPDLGTCVNVGPLNGGHATNIVADSARGWGNLRFATPADGEHLAAALAKLERGSPTDLPAVCIPRVLNRPAKPTLPATEALGLAARAVAEDLGQALPFGSTAGVCDGNNLQDAGLPTIDTLGVRGGGLHTRDEWIEMASLVERCQLLAILISRLCASR